MTWETGGPELASTILQEKNTFIEVNKLLPTEAAANLVKLEGRIVTIPLTSEAATGSVLKNVFLEISQNSLEKICARVSFFIKLQGWDSDTGPTQVFSCEICEISKNIYFT